MLCPTDPASLELKGFQASDVWKVLEVRVEACDNSTATFYTCYSSADIDSYFTTYTNENDYFKVEFLILDT